ncbi:MAG TPA: hypothetical protein VJV79_14805 [Polyangiaceae bacterium]|nr:hypothetical protein [Polyangiaceae bacterium]
MKDWAKERWRKLYLREALEQRLWSVMARGLRDYLIRVAEDDGALIRDSDEPVEALLHALGAHAEEAGLVLKLYVAGFTQPELECVAEFMPKQAWWRNKSLGLASLSAEVVRRNLSAAMTRELSPRLAKVLEDVQRRLEAG